VKGSCCLRNAYQTLVGVLSVVFFLGPHLWVRAMPAAAPGETPVAARPTTETASSGPVRVSGVTIQSGQAGATFVDVATSSPVPYRVLRLRNPQRLVVDLEGAQTTSLRGSYPSESPLLHRVRVGQFRSDDPAVVRIVADLHDNPAFEVHATSNGVRIELKPRNTMTAVIPTAQPASAQAPPTAPPPRVVSQPTPAQAQAPPTQAMPPANLSAGPNVFYLNSPFKSLFQNQKVLDSLGLRIALSFNYKMGKKDEAGWKTVGLPGVVAHRLYIKPLAPGSYRTIELALSQTPRGEFQVAVYGQQVEPRAQGPNPDLMQFQQAANEEIARLGQAPAAPTALSDLSYDTYYLSYVTADRAMALLKTLGYTTVEYNEQAGESLYNKIYNPIKLGTGKPPVIVKLINSTKTSLMEPTTTQPGVPGQMPVGVTQPAAQMGGFGGGAGFSGVPQIGGTFLDKMTSGDPQERLLVLYDKSDPESLQNLLNLLQSTIDVPSREIMIEAQVIEMNANKTRDLGVTFETVQNQVDVANAAADSSGAALTIFSFTKGAPRIASFNAQLQALLTTGQAEILSNPSVLVLDDRQARIQIGQQVPVAQSAVSVGTIASGFSYFPVGIVLNLRPRVNEDGSEITMQTETIVSAINQVATNAQKGCSPTSTSSSTNPCAPVVDNRQVQSIVRVANNTPFIIGGLISTNNSTSMTGIPLLSQIPGLGALFRSTSTTKIKQEVIIVVTPHVVPLEDKYFSYVIPKDSSQFDRFDYKLFRNSYRIRGNDLFDLEFVYDSNVYKNLVNRVKEASTLDPELKTKEPYASVLNGGAPGEDILVRRLLWEIIFKTNYEKYINPDQIIFFKNDPSAPGGAGFQIDYLSQEIKNLKDGQNALALTFEAHPKGTEDRPFVPPKAFVSFTKVSMQDYPEKLIDGNKRNPDGTPKEWQVLLSDEKLPTVRGATALQLLQGAIVLKRVLDLNKDMPLTLQGYHIGRQVLFPSQEELQKGYHLVDREVAKLFYEVFNYYPAFEQEFNRETRQMNAEIDKINQQQ
jgi:Flp pilus assembly secretin CpaC